MERSSWISANSLIPKLLTGLRLAFLLLAINTLIWFLVETVALITDVQVPFPKYQVMFTMSNDGIVQMPESGLADDFQMHLASGWVYAEGLAKSFDISYILLRFLAVLCILITIRFTIKILESAEKGDFFIVENALRLRGIAVLGFGILFFIRMSSLLSAFHLKDKLEFPGILFTNFYTFTFVDFLLLLHFLFLLMVSEAFRRGTLMKEENDLTI